MTWRHVIEGLTPALRRFAQALASEAGPEAADTMVQDALLRAARADPALDAAKIRVRLYATLITLNRARCRAAAMLTTERTSFRPVHGENGALRVGSSAPPVRVDGPAITQALSRLPLPDREALLLVALERVDYLTAAEMLDVTRSTVATRVARARAALAVDSDAGTPVAGVRRPPYLRVVK